MSVADPFGLVGQVLDGQFRVDKLVGEGGFSAVYRGHHQGLHEPIAVKCLKLPAALGTSLVDSFVQRFRDESRILYRLSQGNLHIVRSIAAGTTQAPATGGLVPYMVLEWLEGRTVQNDFTVRQARRESGRSLEEIVDLFAAAADGLAYAHAQGVVHRDLNPGNLFLSSSAKGAKMKVLDFGVAKLMHDSALDLGPRAPTVGQIRMFAPAYGAPEQFDERIGAVGAASDVYSFAVILLEALRDRSVVEGTHLGDFARFTTDPRRRPTPRSLGVAVSEEVEQAFARATALDPAHRWPSAGEFWRSLTFARELGAASAMAAQRSYATAAMPAVSATPLGGFSFASGDPHVGRSSHTPLAPKDAAIGGKPLARTMPLRIHSPNPGSLPLLLPHAAYAPPSAATPDGTALPIDARSGHEPLGFMPERPSSPATARFATVPGVDLPPEYGSSAHDPAGPMRAIDEDDEAATRVGAPSNEVLRTLSTDNADAKVARVTVNSAIVSSASPGVRAQQSSLGGTLMMAPPASKTAGVPRAWPQPTSASAASERAASLPVGLPMEGVAHERPTMPNPLLAGQPPTSQVTPRVSTGPLNVGSPLPVAAIAIVLVVLAVGGLGLGAVALRARHAQRDLLLAPGKAAVASPDAVGSASARAAEPPSAAPVAVPASAVSVALPEALGEPSLAAPEADPSTPPSSRPPAPLSPVLAATPAAPVAPVAPVAVASPAPVSPVASASSKSPFDATAFSESAARSRLTQANGVLAFCKKAGGISGPGTAVVTFSADGTALSVSVEPPYAGTKEGECVASQFRRAKIAPFDGPSQTLRHAFEVPK